MAWVKVDDGFPDHPKTLELSLAAQGLWLVGLCYANRQMTDGVLPAALLRRIGDDGAPAAAAELVAAGLWHQTAAGWEIHEYTDYQRTREQIETVSAVRAAAGRTGGQANGKQTRSKSQANAKQTGGAAAAVASAGASKTQADAKQKRREKKRTEEIAPAGTAPGAVAVPNAAFRMFQALCEETGADESAAAPSYRSQQAAIGRQLLDDGFDESDVRGCIRYLRSQAWRTGIVDLKTVKSEIGRWSAGGRPAAEPTPIRPGVAGAAPQYEAFVAELDAMISGGPK